VQLGVVEFSRGLDRIALPARSRRRMRKLEAGKCPSVELGDGPPHVAFREGRRMREGMAYCSGVLPPTIRSVKILKARIYS
jgi:hypothetical protein